MPSLVDFHCFLVQCPWLCQVPPVSSVTLGFPCLGNPGQHAVFWGEPPVSALQRNLTLAVCTGQFPEPRTSHEDTLSQLPATPSPQSRGRECGGGPGLGEPDGRPAAGELRQSPGCCGRPLSLPSAWPPHPQNRTGAAGPVTARIRNRDGQETDVVLPDQPRSPWKCVGKRASLPRPESKAPPPRLPGSPQRKVLLLGAPPSRGRGMPCWTPTPLGVSASSQNITGD